MLDSVWAVTRDALQSWYVYKYLWKCVYVALGGVIDLRSFKLKSINKLTWNRKEWERQQILNRTENCLRAMRDKITKPGERAKHRLPKLWLCNHHSRESKVLHKNESLDRSGYLPNENNLEPGRTQKDRREWEGIENHCSRTYNISKWNIGLGAGRGGGEIGSALMVTGRGHTNKTLSDLAVNLGIRWSCGRGEGLFRRTALQKFPEDWKRFALLLLLLGVSTWATHSLAWEIMKTGLHLGVPFYFSQQLGHGSFILTQQESLCSSLKTFPGVGFKCSKHGKEGCKGPKFQGWIGPMQGGGEDWSFPHWICPFPSAPSLESRSSIVGKSIMDQMIDDLHYLAVY